MTLHTKVYDDILNFIFLGKKPEEVISFKASEETNKRINCLIEKEKAEILSLEEKAELDYYMLLEHLVILAKARAHKQLRA